MKAVYECKIKDQGGCAEKFRETDIYVERKPMPELKKGAVIQSVEG